MFKDRIEAGQRLAEALSSRKNERPLVLAIPRGGVAVGYQVAEYLQTEFSIVVVRKLPFPDNPEAGFGAIAEDGSTYFVDRAAEMLPSDIIDKIVNEQKHEVAWRVDVLRKGEPLPTIKNRIVILVDDGIAMGSTMRAALLLCRARQAKEIIVASPVAGPAVAAEFEKLADRVIILEKPAVFRAVAQAYKNWYDVTDREVLELMQTRQKRLIDSQSVID